MRNTGKIITGALCGIAAVLFICMLVLSPQNSVQAPKEPVSTASSAQSGPAASETNAPATRYLVKSTDGAVCVYCEGEDKPVTTIETDITALPKVDQELLKAGIPVSSKEELNRLLEDLCS